MFIPLVKPMVEGTKTGLVVIRMERKQEKKYCERCKKETVHAISEDALEIEYRCSECNKEEDVIKTFF
jgi:ribosomal protein L44E